MERRDAAGRLHEVLAFRASAQRAYARHKARRTILTTTRSLLMEPPTSINLNRFLASYARYGIYHLIPAIVSSGEPEWISNLNILKRDLTVTSAADVGEHDIERSALEMILKREAEEV